MDGYGWIWMGMDDYEWLCVRFRPIWMVWVSLGQFWAYMVSYGLIWIGMDDYEWLWVSFSPI